MSPEECESLHFMESISHHLSHGSVCAIEKIYILYITVPLTVDINRFNFKANIICSIFLSSLLHTSVSAVCVCVHACVRACVHVLSCRE